MENKFFIKIICLMIISVLITPIVYSANNVDITIRIPSSTSGGGSSGGGGMVVGTNEIKCVKDVLETSMTVGDILCFMCEGKENIIKLDSLRSDYVIFQINAGQEHLIINLGETKEFDFQGDGSKDIRITLNKTYLGRAYLIFKKLCEELVIEHSTVSYCGDGDCDVRESCNDCHEDCGLCEINKTEKISRASITMNVAGIPVSSDLKYGILFTIALSFLIAVILLFKRKKK